MAYYRTKIILTYLKRLDLVKIVIYYIFIMIGEFEVSLNEIKYSQKKERVKRKGFSLG